MHAINRNTSIVNHKSINLSNSDSGCTCVHGLGASPKHASRAAPRQRLAAINITQWFNSFTAHKKNDSSKGSEESHRGLTASRTGLRKTANARRPSTACCPRGSTKQRAGSAQRCRGCCAKQRTCSLRLLVADHCHGEATARCPWEVVAAREKLAAMEEWNYAGRGAGFLRDVHGRGIRPWRAPGRGRAQPRQAQGRGGRCCCCFWIEELGAGNLDAMDREVENTMAGACGAGRRGSGRSLAGQGRAGEADAMEGGEQREPGENGSQGELTAMEKIIGQRGARPCPGTGAMGKLELAGRGTTICCRVRAGAWRREMPWRQQRASAKPCRTPARSWFPCENERW
jgi:hypothetical protein